MCARVDNAQSFRAAVVSAAFLCIMQRLASSLAFVRKTRDEP